MIEPPPISRIERRAIWAAKNWCLRLTSIAQSQSASVDLVRVLAPVVGGVVDEDAIGPSRWRASSIAASSAARFSQVAFEEQRLLRAGGEALDQRQDWSLSMSTKATLAPWPTKASTIAAPIPEPPPVMKTTRSRRLG